MSNVELHFFAANDLNGATILEISDEDDYFESLELRISLSELGSGQFTLSRQVGFALFDSGAFQPETFVRVLIPAISADRYVWGFFLDNRLQTVVSSDEAGGEDFTFGGPGPKFYLSRAALWFTQFVGVGWHIDRPNGVFRWAETATPGRVLNSLINEDQANTTATFLPDLTQSFTDANDSDSDPWTDTIAADGEFELPIGQSFLEDLWALEDSGDLETTMFLGTVGTPRMRLDAWQGYGRDLGAGSITDFSADKVHFKEAVNIVSDLVVNGSSLRKASHAIVHGLEGAYVVAERATWDPGEYAKVVLLEHGQTKNQAVLGRYGLRYLQHQDNGEREIQFEIAPGFAPTAGKYFPSMPEGDGHFWIGDTVSLTTGGDAGGSWTPLDYRVEDQRVTAIRMVLDEASVDTDSTTQALSWHVVPELNVERGGASSPRDGQITGEAGCNCPGLCVAAAQTELEVQDHVDSGQAVGHFGILARDGDDGTSWSTNGFPVNIQHWGPDFGSAVVVNAMRFLQSAGAANAATSINVYATNDDAKWATFDAWNNHNFDFVGNAWTLVDTLIGLTVGDNGTLSIAGSTAYRYWALRATAGGGNGWEVFTFTFYSLSGGDDTEEFVGTSARASRCDHQHHAENVIFEDGTTLEDSGPAGPDLTGVNFLVGTASADLSAEIVVGTTPGGELGGTWGSPTVDATHSGSTHSAASDVHVADTSAAHVASSIGFTPNGSIAATDVQAAIQEVRDEAASAVDLDDLTDVTISSPVLGDMLRYNGTVWVNTPGRWEPATAGVDTFVWDGDDLVMGWKDT